MNRKASASVLRVISLFVFGFSPSAQSPGALHREPNTTLRLPPDLTDLEASPLPPTLAETGSFTDLASLTPHPGIVPYDLNVSFWSDGAHKTRWFSVPDTTQTIGFERETSWTFPIGTTWIKHFELELTNGVPESARRLETRFLVRTEEGIYGVTYRWDDSQTDATLVGEDGLALEDLASAFGMRASRPQRQMPESSTVVSCRSCLMVLRTGLSCPVH